VLIVGAGPAGSAAAIVLARAGLRVVLTDARTFPRDKVCGDGLISDALAALATLGIRDRVLRMAAAGPAFCIQPPWGRLVSLSGEFACLPRERLDALLVETAREAGAQVLCGATGAGPVLEAARVQGARVTAAGGGGTIRAPVTLLATGANATALKAFGLAASSQPSAVAGRAYYEAPPALVEEFRGLIIGYDRDWCPGYGWIFPSPGGRFNIGVGLFTRAAGERRLRDFWEAFISRFPVAARIVRASKALGPFRGAPLRTALAGASFGRAGLLTIGEAASLTYAATGEGIGKAMESGILAARLAVEALGGHRPLETLHAAYERQFTDAFALRYHAYSVAQAWAANPLVLSLLAARTNAGTFARQELEDLLAERGDARRLFSKRGLLKTIFR
jgi:geranylgeranyl reductase family protein